VVPCSFLQLALACGLREDSSVVASCVRLRDLDPEFQRHQSLEEEALALCQSAIKYRVLGRAGAGAFGVVFKVRTYHSAPMEHPRLVTLVVTFITSRCPSAPLCRQVTCTQAGHPDPRRVYALKMLYNFDATTTNGILLRTEVCYWRAKRDPLPWSLTSYGG
jgi:hypothetical protein